MKIQDVPKCYRSSDWRALVAGMRGEPGNPVRPLVIADWLQEQDQEEHAEFIRKSVEFEATAVSAVAWGTREARDEMRRLEMSHHNNFFYRLGFSLLKPGLSEFFTPGREWPMVVVRRLVSNELYAARIGIRNGFPSVRKDEVLIELGAARAELVPLLMMFPCLVQPPVERDLHLMGGSNAWSRTARNEPYGYQDLPPRFFDRLAVVRRGRRGVRQLVAHYTSAAEATADLRGAFAMWANERAGWEVVPTSHPALKEKV